MLIVLLIYILQYDTVDVANNQSDRIAIVQCTVKERLPFLVDGISRSFHDEVYKLDTYSRNLFQWLYPLKQNSLVEFVHCNLQGPIGKMLPESTTASQDSDLCLI